MGCPHNDDYVCFACEEAVHDATCGGADPDCPTCKYRSIRLSAACHPTKTPSPTPPHRPNASWEAGLATDHRGVPYLDKKLNPLGVKQFAENRSGYEADIRRLRNAPAPGGN